MSLLAQSILPRIQQVVREDAQSTKNIKKKILEDINHSILDKRKMMYDMMVIAINEYRHKEYFERKNKRIAHIGRHTSEEIAVWVFQAVIDKKMEPIQNVATRLGSHLGFQNPFNAVETAAEILAVCRHVGLFDIYGNPLRIDCGLTLPLETKDFIERTRYLDPLVTQPKDWTTNSNGGYLTIRHSALLGNEYHKENLCLDVLNIAQKTKFALDIHMLDIKEESTKPLNTLKKKVAFQTRERITNQVSQELLEAGNCFCFQHRWCFRGRLYMQGYYVNLQSDSFRKAALNFAEPQLIGGTL